MEICDAYVSRRGLKVFMQNLLRTRKNVHFDTVFVTRLIVIIEYIILSYTIYASDVFVFTLMCDTSFIYEKKKKLHCLF